MWNRKDLNGKDKTETTTENPKGHCSKDAFPFKANK